ncbi:MAG: formylglycine-generating enzyme family protein [Mariniphaga sp.]|nr:formylglycine-generating enzyme family protein [Mariniphaga sp.]
MWIIILILVIGVIYIISAQNGSSTTITNQSNSNIVQAKNVIPVQVSPPEMVQIIGGTFTMGCNPDSENIHSLWKDVLEMEKPPHLVSVNNFKISKTVVTNDQYTVFLNDCYIDSDSIYNGNKLLDLTHEDFLSCVQLEYVDGSWRIKRNSYGEPMYEGYPMIGATWFGADEYCKWAGGHLPTEAEWEYAARGGKETHGYKYAGSNDIEEVAWYRSNALMSKLQQPNKVARKKPNELGLYDMSGNTQEWCNDWFGNYTPGLSYTSGAQDRCRVIRGGGKNSLDVCCCITHRNYNSPNYGSFDLGFRLVLP